MKTLLSLLAVAALSGCAVYPSAAYDTYDGSVVAPYGVVQPMYIYGGGLYPYGAYGAYGAYPRGYYRAFPYHAPRPHLHAPGAGHGARGGIRNGPRGPHRR